ncbi:MAG: pyridoxamine 5'-phosphate oxidase family protein, partial [Acidimicrobiales bacterium]
VFFVATAPLAGDGHVNCSPKGNRGELAVLDERRVAYLDQTGSGVETIAHLQENRRIVLMFCSFEGPPRVVRLHGTGTVSYPGSARFTAAADHFPGAGGVGVRAIITVDVERVADSCGYGVPLMGFGGFRPTLDEWAERKGPEGIRAYWVEKNAAGIDGARGVPAPVDPH